jgi:hypothetical protein
VGPFTANMIGNATRSTKLMVVGAFKAFAVIIGIMLLIGFVKVVKL